MESEISQNNEILHCLKCNAIVQPEQKRCPNCGYTLANVRLYNPKYFIILSLLLSAIVPIYLASVNWGRMGQISTRRKWLLLGLSGFVILFLCLLLLPDSGRAGSNLIGYLINLPIGYFLSTKQRPLYKKALGLGAIPASTFIGSIKGLGITLILLLVSIVAMVITTDSLLKRGQSLYEQNRCKEAASIFEWLLELDTEDEYLNYDLAKCYICLKQWDKAVDYLKIFLKFHDDDADAHQNLAYALEQQGNIEESEEHYIIADSLYNMDSFTIKPDEIYVHLFMINVETKGVGEQIINRLKNGEDFYYLAILYNQGSDKKLGGSTGYISLNDLNEKFKKVVENLNSGEQSPLIKTKTGYTILYVDNKKYGSELKQLEDAVKNLNINFPEIEGWYGPRQVYLKDFGPISGIKISYEHPEDIIMTIFIYNSGLHYIINDLNSIIFKKELNGCMNAVFNQVDLGAFKKVAKIDSNLVYLGDNPECKKAVRIRFLVSIEEKEYNSELYLTVYKDFYFKIRCTYPNTKSTFNNPHLNLFYDEICKTVSY